LASKPKRRIPASKTSRGTKRRSHSITRSGTLRTCSAARRMSSTTPTARAAARPPSTSRPVVRLTGPPGGEGVSAAGAPPGAPTGWAGAGGAAGATGHAPVPAGNRRRPLSCAFMGLPSGLVPSVASAGRSRGCLAAYAAPGAATVTVATPPRRAETGCPSADSPSISRAPPLPLGGPLGPARPRHAGTLCSARTAPGARSGHAVPMAPLLAGRASRTPEPPSRRWG
jgi:hypothetical protein